MKTWYRENKRNQYLYSRLLNNVKLDGIRDFDWQIDQCAYEKKHFKTAQKPTEFLKWYQKASNI